PFDENFIYMADLVPTAHHIPIPWVMGYDISPGQTTKDKKEFYQIIANEKKTMIFEHDMKTWGAKIAFDDGVPVVLEAYPTSEEKVMEILNLAGPDLQLIAAVFD